jgi:hypothetical protein
MKNREEIQRLEGLLLLIEPTHVEEQEMSQLKQHKTNHSNHSSVAFDDDDPDPECRAARLQMRASELYDESHRRLERSCAMAERYYAKRGKEMNRAGLSH